MHRSRILLVLMGVIACREQVGDGSAPSDRGALPTDPSADPEPRTAWSAGGALGNLEPMARAGSSGTGRAGANAADPEGVAGGSRSCTGQSASLAELASGAVRSGGEVLVRGVVATSQKFLVSASKSSGACLWGAMFADPAVSGANSAVFALSYGASINPGSDAGAGNCPVGSDALPDDLAPGDSADAFGVFSEFVPSACSATAPMRELRVSSGCPLTRHGRLPVPEASVLSREIADRLARGDDPELARAYSGALVRMADLSALQDGTAPDVVGPYGIVRFAETTLELHGKIPYYDLSLGGPTDPAKALDFAYPTHFASVTGLIFLDYCTWSLALRDRCADANPPSAGCAGR